MTKNAISSLQLAHIQLDYHDADETVEITLHCEDRTTVRMSLDEWLEMTDAFMKIVNSTQQMANDD